MANPLKGEVSFEVDGRLYNFKFGTNAQCIIEERKKMSMVAYMKQIGDSSGGTFGALDLRLIFFAGLSSSHQMSETECGDLIDKLGHDRCGNIFMQAVGLAAPKGNGVADPTMPGQQAGQIGTDS